jgi:hypothetical protein
MCFEFGLLVATLEEKSCSEKNGSCLVFFYILMDFGRFFFYRQLWKKLGFWSVYKNPKTKKPKEIKA